MSSSEKNEIPGLHPPFLSREEAVNLLIAPLIMEDLGLTKRMLENQNQELKKLVDIFSEITETPITVEDILKARTRLSQLLDTLKGKYPTPHTHSVNEKDVINETTDYNEEKTVKQSNNKDKTNEREEIGETENQDHPVKKTRDTDHDPTREGEKRRTYSPGGREEGTTGNTKKAKSTEKVSEKGILSERFDKKDKNTSFREKHTQDDFQKTVDHGYKTETEGNPLENHSEMKRKSNPTKESTEEEKGAQSLTKKSGSKSKSFTKDNPNRREETPQKHNPEAKESNPKKYTGTELSFEKENSQESKNGSLILDTGDSTPPTKAKMEKNTWGKSKRAEEDPSHGKKTEEYGEGSVPLDSEGATTGKTKHRTSTHTTKDKKKSTSTKNTTEGEKTAGLHDHRPDPSSKAGETEENLSLSTKPTLAGKRGDSGDRNSHHPRTKKTPLFGEDQPTTDLHKSKEYEEECGCSRDKKPKPKPPSPDIPPHHGGKKGNITPKKTEQSAENNIISKYKNDLSAKEEDTLIVDGDGGECTTTDSPLQKKKQNQPPSTETLQEKTIPFPKTPSHTTKPSKVSTPHPTRTELKHPKTKETTNRSTTPTSTSPSQKKNSTHSAKPTGTPNDIPPPTEKKR
ncbi:hypothetical protein [Pasteuria penetrans]|uniref:hypothetical protein n=1 Tax=Pasteuria penetrans TaxID=86005 RepID=UPI000FA18F9A|nr:hypothetical protein [Pasteuria penetrans]